MSSRPGILISLEGTDGCGKSTQIRLLRRALLQRGARIGYAGAPGGLLREPGGTPLGESIRRQLLHRRQQMDPWAEAMLYAAARAQLTRAVLAPSLAEGWVVLIDRFVDSSLAYQGHARGLGIEEVLQLSLHATGGLLPHVTVVLRIDPMAAAGRRNGPGDRIEREGLAFQRRVAEGYELVARRFPERVRIIDGERARPQVAADVLAAVLPALERAGVR